MTASLKVRNGVYQMVFSYKDSCGKWRQRCESTGLKEKGNKRKAETLMKERLAELEALAVKQIEISGTLSLNAMEERLDTTMRGRVRENTLTIYRMTFQKHIKTYKPFFGVAVQDVTPRLLQKYIDDKQREGISAETILKHYSNINQFFKYCFRLEMIDRNPVERVLPPVKHKQSVGRAITAEQIKKLHSIFVGDPLETVVFLASMYGLRRSEVCGLRWESINLEGGYLHINHTAVTKGDGTNMCGQSRQNRGCSAVTATVIQDLFAVGLMGDQSSRNM